jgi:hypothetical protein
MEDIMSVGKRNVVSWLLCLSSAELGIVVSCCFKCLLFFDAFCLVLSLRSSLPSCL